MRICRSIASVVCRRCISDFASWLTHWRRIGRPSRLPSSIGFPAGSGVDMVGRTLQESMEKRLNAASSRNTVGRRRQSRVRVRREGGRTATRYCWAGGDARRERRALQDIPAVDVEADFTPIAPLVDVSNVLTINPDVIDVKTVKEFIDNVKANPGKYNYASTGNGTGTHLAFAEFNAKAGLNMPHVPYKGGAEAIQGVIKGDTCCIVRAGADRYPALESGAPAVAWRLDESPRKCGPRDTDDRRSGLARFRELYVVRLVRTERTRSANRECD